MKNLGERSVRMPNRVKRGCGGLKYDNNNTKKMPHYKYNVTDNQHKTTKTTAKPL